MFYVGMHPEINLSNTFAGRCEYTISLTTHAHSLKMALCLQLTLATY